MHDKIGVSLVSAVRQAFEDLCFMYEAPELAQEQAEQPWATAAEVKFRGDFSGKLLLRVSPGLFQAVAARMLGTADLAPGQMEDALCELANVICGNIIPSIADGRSGLVIGIPRIASPDLQTHRRLGSAVASCPLSLGEGRAEAVVFIDGYFGREGRQP
jgi:CheY-specific phosphatase CheX